MRTKRWIASLFVGALLCATSAAFAGGDAAAGKIKAAECLACHGEKGVSASGMFPTLAGQYADYLVNALKQYKSGERKNAVMAGLVVNLTEEDMENLAAYYASQTGLKTLPSK